MVLRSTHTTTLCEPALARHWQMAVDNPSCITHEIFCTMLRHHPPLHVVQSLLSLNRTLAVCPPNEATPALHVGVQSNCELAIIACLVEAWPEGLLRKAPCGRSQVRMDPLMYAKLYRRSDFRLIELLSTNNVSACQKSDFVTLNGLCQSQYSTLVNDSSKATETGTEKSFAPRVQYVNHTLTSAVPSLAVKRFTSDSGDDGNDASATPGVVNDEVSRLGAKPIYSPLIEPTYTGDKIDQVYHQHIHAAMSYEQEMAELRATCKGVLREHHRLVERVKILEDQDKVKACQSKERNEAWRSELMSSVAMQVNRQLYQQSKALEKIVERLEHDVLSSHKDTRLQSELMNSRTSQTELMMLYMQQQMEERFPVDRTQARKRSNKQKVQDEKDTADDSRSLLREDEYHDLSKKPYQLGHKRRFSKRLGIFYVRHNCARNIGKLTVPL